MCMNENRRECQYNCEYSILNGNILVNCNEILMQDKPAYRCICIEPNRNKSTNPNYVFFANMIADQVECSGVSWVVGEGI